MNMQLIFFSNYAQASNSTLTFFFFYLTVPLTVEESDFFLPPDVRKQRLKWFLTSTIFL